MNADKNGPEGAESDCGAPIAKAQGRVPLLVRPLRILGALVFVTGAFTALSSATQCVLVCRLNSIYLERLPSYVAFLITNSILFGGVALAALLFVRYLGNRFYLPLGPGEEPSTMILGLILVGGIVAWMPMLFEASKAIAQLGLVVASLFGLVMLLLYGVFRWRVYIVVGLGMGLAGASATAPVPHQERLQEVTALRNKVFDTAIQTCTTKCAEQDFVAAIRSPELIDPWNRPIDHFVVLAAVPKKNRAKFSLSICPLEAYLAEGLLASSPSDLKAVVVVGPFGEEGPGSAFSPRLAPGTRLVAPVLIYEWPENTLVERASIVAPHGAPIPRVAAELDRTLRGLR